MGPKPPFESIAAHSPDSIMLLDRDATIRFINRTAPGLSIDDVIGTRVYAYVPDDQHEAMRQCFAEVVERREPGRYENVYATGDGHISHWESRVGPILEHEAVTGFVVFSSNVTDRREAALERDRIFELSLDMLCVVSFDGYFKRMNPAFGRTLGFSDAELLARPFIDFVHPEDRPKSVAAFETLVNEHSSVTELENRYVAKDGHHHVMQWAATVDPGSRRIIAVARDVTEQRALEAQLLQAQKMDAIGQLAGGVAHDFNNLLLSILGNARFASEAATIEAATPHLEEIKVAGDRAAELTKQLLAFSRRQPVVKTQVDLNTLAGDMMTLLRRLIPESIEIDLIAGHQLSGIRADQSQIEQVLMNLCLNARDAMPGGGRMTIETENVQINGGYTDRHPWTKPGRYVLLTVTDSGSGMTPEICQHVFEPFFTTKAPGEGTGLGLATAYGIVQQHDGMIHVYSEPDQGTTFKVYLPVTVRLATEVGSKIEPAPQGGKETILLAEDDPLVRRVVVQMLERAGYRVLVATNGHEAVEHCRGDVKVDLAVLDVVMPELGGPEAAIRMRELRPGLPVVFCSGYSAGSRSGGVPDDAVVMVKPFKVEELLSQVRAHLDAST